MIVPARVALGMMLYGLVLGILVGAGATPWCLLSVPLVAVGAIGANRR